VPTDRSANTAPGREKREGGSWGEGQEADNLQAQSAATCLAPGKSPARLPPDQGTSALPGKREEQSSLAAVRQPACCSHLMGLSSVSHKLCMQMLIRKFFRVYGSGLSLHIHSFFTTVCVWSASVLRSALLVTSG